MLPRLAPNFRERKIQFGNFITHFPFCQFVRRTAAAAGKVLCPKISYRKMEMKLNAEHYLWRCAYQMGKGRGWGRGRGLLQMHPLLLGMERTTLAACYVRGFERNLLCFPFTFPWHFVSSLTSFFHYYLVSNLHIVRASWFWSWHAPPYRYLRSWPKGHPSSWQPPPKNLLPPKGLTVLCASASLHRVLLLLLLHLKFIRQLQVKS